MEPTPTDASSLTWADGSHYEGGMRDCFREGYGVHVWANGERYEGEYERDRREGQGVYHWPNGAKYVGGFCSDKKEGEGVMYLGSGNRFEGHYCNDERNGEGTLFYPDGHVDKGIWLGDHIIRLLFDIPEASPGYQASEDLDTPDFKFRGTSSPKGALERESQKLIQSAASGDSMRIDALLKTGNVYVNVVDRSGHSALLAASIHGHLETIRVLLDEGAHINLLSDQGFSPLSATFHRLYLLQNCPVLNVHQGCLTSPKTVLGSGSDCSSNTVILYNAELDTLTPSSPSDGCLTSPKTVLGSGSDCSSNTVILYNAELDTLTPSSPSDVSLEEECVLGQRDVYTTPRFFLGRRSTAMEDADANSEDVRGLYPEFDCNLNTRLVSAPAKAMESKPIQTKPILKKNRSECEVSDETDSELESEQLVEGKGEVSGGAKIPQIISQGWLKPTEPICSSRIALTPGSGDHLGDFASASDSISIHLGERESLPPPSTSSSLKPSLVQNLETSIDLLLKCSADVNATLSPLPAIFYPVLAGDAGMACRLIGAGADVNVRLRMEQGGSGLLHLLASQQDTLNAGMLMKLLLEGGADPNRLETDDDDETNTDTSTQPIPGSNAGFSGNSPLHILASRMCDSPDVTSLAHLLLTHGANPDTVCKGHSPLSLSILNNNHHMIELLLDNKVDINLALGQGVASALSVVTSLRSQTLRPVQKSIRLFKTLLDCGANILLQIEMKPEIELGTVVDFAHSAFQEDKRCSELPFHSMTRIERQRFLARTKLLKFVTNTFRKTIRMTGMKISQQKLFETQKSLNEILNFDFTGLAELIDEEERKSKATSRNSKRLKCGKQSPTKTQSPHSSATVLLGKAKSREIGSVKKVALKKVPTEHHEVGTADGFSIANHKGRIDNFTELKMSIEFISMKFCEYCCKSIGVNLVVCNRCHLVRFCSRSCKLRAWEGWHKRECLVVEGRRQKSVKFQTQEQKSEILSGAEQVNLLSA